MTFRMTRLYALAGSKKSTKKINTTRKLTQTFEPSKTHPSEETELCFSCQEAIPTDGKLNYIKEANKLIQKRNSVPTMAIQFGFYVIKKRLCRKLMCTYFFNQLLCIHSSTNSVNMLTKPIKNRIKTSFPNMIFGWTY